MTARRRRRNPVGLGKPHFYRIPGLWVCTQVSHDDGIGPSLRAAYRDFRGRARIARALRLHAAA